MFWLIMSILTVVLVGVDAYKRVGRPAGAPEVKGWFLFPVLASWGAFYFITELLTVAAGGYRDIPWVYLWVAAGLWTAATVVLAVLQFHQEANHAVMDKLTEWGCRSVFFWKEDNLPTISAVAIGLLCLATFFLQGPPSFGPDWEEAKHWGVSQDVSANVHGIGQWLKGEGGIPAIERAAGRRPATVMAAKPPLLPRYPRYWFWLVAVPICALAAAFFFPFNFRDEAADMVRNLAEAVRLKRSLPEVQVVTSAPAETRGKAETSKTVPPASPATPPATPAPSAGERRGVGYWITHFLSDLATDFVTDAITHRKGK